MARRVRVNTLIWPAWFYGPNDKSGIFESESQVPDGWVRKRGALEPVIDRPSTLILDRNVLIAQLEELDVPIKPTWGNAHMQRIIDGDVSSAW